MPHGASLTTSGSTAFHACRLPFLNRPLRLPVGLALFHCFSHDRARQSRLALDVRCFRYGSLIETASTTGYVTVGVMWSAICASMLITLVLKGRVNPQALLSVAVMAIGAAVALYAMPSASLILNGVLFGKSGSESSAHRVATIGRSVTVFYRTLFLGAGLGSNRAMSMMFYVLSNIGLPGLVLLVYLLFQLCRRYQEATRLAPNRQLRQFIQASGAGFLAYLVAMVFSGAEITTPLLWVLWGMLLAGIRQSWLFAMADSEQEIAAHRRWPCLESGVSGLPHYASSMS